MGQLVTPDHCPTRAGEGPETVTAWTALVVVLPAKSLATAESAWGPMPAVAVFHWMVYGAPTSPPRFAPSNRNCTPATPISSEAAAVTPIVPVTVSPSNGEVSDTVGGVVSGGGGVPPTGVFMSFWISDCVRARL